MQAVFVKSIRGTDPITHDGRFQVAFIGRSNVGKSSVINSLLGTSKLVRSSSHPGQTKMINFFLVNGKMYLVDLPGYGYAKMSLADRHQIAKMMSWYLEESDADIRTVALIIDAQVGLRDIDRRILETMREIGRRVVVVANKADRLKQGERIETEKNIRAELDGEPFFLYSAKSGRGRERIWNEIVQETSALGD